MSSEPPPKPPDDPDQPDDERDARLVDEPDAGERVVLALADLGEPLPELATAAIERAPSRQSATVDPTTDPATSGSVDVALSNPALPASASGSVDIALSNPALPASASGSVDVALASDTAIPRQATELDSQPVATSGAVPIAVPTAHEGTGPVRRKRVTAALSGGVEVLGAGIGTLGEGVTKVGDFTRKVPLVGASIGSIGEGLTRAGESIHALPRVAQTRRGRLLVRSVVVGFSIVFAWIALIVLFQVRVHNTPDFRPEAERILVEMGKGRGSVSQVYERASPRFHEIVKRERFMDDMADLYATNGPFREITAINETIVTTGPTGRVGRVGLTAAFEHGISRGSISFHWHEGQWKLLGIGIELPDNLEITQTQRQQRVAACVDDKGRDVSDQRRKCGVRDAAETILERIRDGRAGEVWDAAHDIFKHQESRTRFIQIQDEQRAALGAYKRLLTVTDARAIGGVSATFDAVAEFERSSGVRVEFDFSRPSKFEAWTLRRFKVTLPMPRPGDTPPEANQMVPPPPDPPRGG